MWNDDDTICREPALGRRLRLRPDERLPLPAV